MDISILGLSRPSRNHAGIARRIARCRLGATFSGFALSLWMMALPFGSLEAARGKFAQAPLTPSEAQIKAAFLLNFARFAEWSPVSLPDASTVLIFCFDGAEDVRIAFEALAEGKEIKGRKLVNRKLSSPANAKSCHAVFANDSKRSREIELLKTALGAGALTVGDGPDFLASGGMIQLVVDDSKMRFDVNLAAVSRAKLKLSSKLLALARHVVELPVEAAN
jgi:hypothetical protein